jgi:multicomponent Na+:H+ antiporter subunit B
VDQAVAHGQGRTHIAYLVDIVLLVFLLVLAVTVIRLRNLVAVVMLFSVYSLVTAALFVNLDAVDVAFTEAAVGAGITTVLMFATLALTSAREKIPVQTSVLPLLIVAATGGVLVYGTLDMPDFGDPAAPAHQHVAPRYLESGPSETGVPNVVTAVLASYRGYDTLGEVAVIFTAGVGVMLLIGGAVRRRTPGEDR